jgi:hypothetical protein
MAMPLPPPRLRIRTGFGIGFGVGAIARSPRRGRGAVWEGGVERLKKETGTM